MEVKREVNIKKVSNGYILEELSDIQPETRVYRDFADLVNWIAFLFKEVGVNEKVELIRKQKM